MPNREAIANRTEPMIAPSRKNCLVFDLGMNNGDDTDYYLRKGYDVVAVEANPLLVQSASERFSPAISAGRLTVMHRAICESSGPVSFFINNENDHLSSIDIGWASRADAVCREIQVEGVTLKDLFAQFGVPGYLKIDVEGADKNVLEQLAMEPERPNFVSVEDCRFGFEYVEILSAGGYNRFKLLDQSTVPSLYDLELSHKFPSSSSGPFGDDVPGEWVDKDAMLEIYAKTVRDRAGNRLAPQTQWWDIHCTTL